MADTNKHTHCIYSAVTVKPQYFPLCESIEGSKSLIPVMCAVVVAKPYCTIMNTALMEAVRHTGGLVMQQLC